MHQNCRREAHQNRNREHEPREKYEMGDFGHGVCEIGRAVSVLQRYCNAMPQSTLRRLSIAVITGLCNYYHRTINPLSNVRRLKSRHDRAEPLLFEHPPLSCQVRMVRSGPNKPFRTRMNWSEWSGVSCKDTGSDRIPGPTLGLPS